MKAAQPLQTAFKKAFKVTKLTNLTGEQDRLLDSIHETIDKFQSALNVLGNTPTSRLALGGAVATYLGALIDDDLIGRMVVQCDDAINWDTPCELTITYYVNFSKEGDTDWHFGVIGEEEIVDSIIKDQEDTDAS